jgi:hypothetical protein
MKMGWMSRQAVALLVHQNVDQVNELIEILEKDFDVYVHIDKKSTIQPEDINSMYVWKEYKVKWGGYGMVEATVFLYKKALLSGNLYTHIILLSGDSLPIKSNEYITEYLSAHNGVSFLENLPLSESKLERHTLLWFNEDLKKRTGINYIFRIIRFLQRRLGIKRSIKGFERTGSQWAILSREHAQHLLKHCKFSTYKSRAVPDESFLQDHFYNYGIPHRECLIYAHWQNKTSYSPQIIDEFTYESLTKSPYLFARKFENTRGYDYVFRRRQPEMARVSAR